MVFHMLRRTVGEEAFWGALRDVYREQLFVADVLGRPASRVRKALRPPARSLLRPVGRPQGGPPHPPRDVQTVRRADRLNVTGRLVQEKPFFTADLEVALDEDGSTRLPAAVHGRRHDPFRTRPPPAETARLSADPDHHLLRRLDRRKSRRPSTCSRVRRPCSWSCAPRPRRTAGRWPKLWRSRSGCRPTRSPTRRTSTAHGSTAATSSSWGYPRNPEWLHTHPDAVRLDAHGFALEPRRGGHRTRMRSSGCLRTLTTTAGCSPCCSRSRRRMPNALPPRSRTTGVTAILSSRGTRTVPGGSWPVETSPVSQRIP